MCENSGSRSGTNTLELWRWSHRDSSKRRDEMGYSDTAKDAWS